MYRTVLQNILYLTLNMSFLFICVYNVYVRLKLPNSLYHILKNFLSFSLNMKYIHTKTLCNKKYNCNP